MAKYDVIIVGAGLTGLTAAYRLIKGGLNVLVIEARDRVGGRTYTVDEKWNGADSPFDFGAHFVGNEPYQMPIINLIGELDLETFEQYEGPEDVEPTPEEFWAGQGANLQWMDKEITAYIGTTIPPDPSGMAALVYMLGLADSVRLDAVHLTPNAEIIDKLSVWEWLTQLDLPDWGPVPNSFRSQVRMLCRVGFSCEPEDLSMLWLLFYLKSNGGLIRFQSVRWPVQGAQGFRLKKGAQSIAFKLAEVVGASASGTIVLGTPVSAITETEDGVTVTAGGQTYTAPNALVALAPPLLPTIAFSPPLTPARALAAGSMRNSSMILAYVLFDTAFWRKNTAQYTTGTANGIPVKDISKYGLSGDVLLADWPVVWIMDNSSFEGQPALMAFMVGKEADDLRAASIQEREVMVIDTMCACFGRDAIKNNNPVYREMDWNGEVYSKGCPAGHFPPGTFLSAAPGVLLQTPGAENKGRIRFASTESASIANGYMSGAVWSGETVAADILEATVGQLIWPRNTFLREIAMRDAVKVIMQAIANQNPMMEWPALASTCDFSGPGGRTLPADHYIGQDGTVEFYARMGFFITLTRVNVINISVDVANNTALAEFTVDGFVNTTQIPFRGVEASMVFEFTDPSEPAALIQRDWLLMDTDLIDRLVFDSAPVDVQTLDRLQIAANDLAVSLNTALTTGSPVTDPRCARTIIYGAGGAAFPKGPYFGFDGFAKVGEMLRKTDFITSWAVTSQVTDMTARATLQVFVISGKGAVSGKPFQQRCLQIFRFSNDDALDLESLSFVTDSTTLN